MPSNNIDPAYRRKLAWLLAFVVALIIYGSLYPWEFEAVPGIDPLNRLLHSWDFSLNRFMLGDVGINIVLYMPLGFLAYLVFRRPHSLSVSILLPTLIGFALSCSVEMTQAYEPARQTSLTDVLTNVIGTIAGAIGARALQRFVGPIGSRLAARKQRDASALLLLAIFTAWLLFPLFPIPGRTALRTKLGVIVHGRPLLDPALLLPAICAWYAAGLLIRAAGMEKRRLWAALSLVPLLAEIVIIHHEPWVATIIGAALGAAAAALFSPTPLVAAIAVVLTIVARGLQPFEFNATAQPFLWIPFEGFLSMDWVTGIQVILEKVFYYGAAIWLLRASGMRLWRATALIAAVLAILEAIQTHIPPHTPEITDPLLALLLGFAIGAVNPYRGTEIRSRSSE